MTRGELIQLLESEAYNDAASRVAGGEDPHGVVLAVLNDQSPLYDDDHSGLAHATLAAIVRDEIAVVEREATSDDGP